MTSGPILSSRLRVEGGRWVYRGARPSGACHAHGFTAKTLTVLHRDQLQRVVVYKQRWLWPDGTTTHGRPPQDISWSRYGLLLVFGAVWTWLSSPVGLHHTAWPWRADRPARRSVQRWLARLLENALAWQVALRGAVVDALVPRLIDEQFPAGLPPPGGIARWRADPARRVSLLADGLGLLENRTVLDEPIRNAVLAEARRRIAAAGTSMTTH